jgi:hypothetical protein
MNGIGMIEVKSDRKTRLGAQSVKRGINLKRSDHGGHRRGTDPLVFRKYLFGPTGTNV